MPYKFKQHKLLLVWNKRNVLFKLWTVDAWMFMKMAIYLQLCWKGVERWNMDRITKEVPPKAALSLLPPGVRSSRGWPKMLWSAAWPTHTHLGRDGTPHTGAARQPRPRHTGSKGALVVLSSLYWRNRDKNYFCCSQTDGLVEGGRLRTSTWPMGRPQSRGRCLVAYPQPPLLTKHSILALLRIAGQDQKKQRAK